MGAEAKCDADFDGKRHAGKALLETADVLFRASAADGPRVKLAFADLAEASAADGVLTLRGKRGRPSMALHLGAAAEKWLKKILHPPSRLDKLGVKPGLTVYLAGELEGELAGFAGELEERGAKLAKLARGVDLVFLVAPHRRALGRLAELGAAMQRAGALWVLRPKGSPDISEAEVLAAGKRAGLVDVKVAAFSAKYTAEKLVIPVAQR